MRKNIFVKFLSLSVLCCGLLSPAYALADSGDGELVWSFFGLANRGVEDDGSGNDDDKYNFGAGAFIESNVNGNLGLETGVMYIKRQYDFEAGSVRGVQQVKRLHIPVMARFWIADIFSVAAGPYAAFKVGNVKNTLELGGFSASQETNADDDVEFGYDLAATLNFAVDDKTGIFVEGRYSQPFDKADDVDYEELTGLVGVKISM